MSLHQYLVSPPLALAIYPAKPTKAPLADKAKDKPTDQKPDPQAKLQEKAEDGKKPAADHLNPPQNGSKPGPDQKQPIIGPNVPAKWQEAAPDSPGLMNPEPPTPADGVVHGDDQVSPDPANKGQVREQPKPLDAVKAGPVQGEPENKRADAHEVTENHLASKEDKSSESEASPQSDDEPLPEPLCLLGPPPRYPIRARLDLDPSKPWPPIEADPRGAYHLYAKGCKQGIIESVYIDVLKDSWMSEQWKDKSERDALAKLRGDDLKKARRNLEVEARKRRTRKVPKKADEVLIMLWNILVEASNNELPTEEFWSAFDWEDPAAQIHAKDFPPEKLNHNKFIDVDGQQVEWTKAGLEKILATVGIQCTYNSDEPIEPVHTDQYPGTFTQDRAFMLLGHGHFMLRLREWLDFKPEDIAGKFEVLVVSGHDRILGDMVRQYRMEQKKKEEKEYIEKKKAQKQAEAEKARGAVEAKGKAGKELDNQGGGNGKENHEKGTEAVEDPKQIEVTAAKEERKDKRVTDGKLLVAVPVHAGAIKAQDKANVLDQKHDGSPILAGPGKAAKAAAKVNEGIGEKVQGKDGGKGGGEEAVRDPVRDAGKIAKMIGDPSNLKMEDIQVALKVLEAASGTGGVSKVKEEKKESTGLVWTWGEACESWRWKNWEAGVHDVGLGGWEERDWKVFADDRGCDDFEMDMQSAEEVEEDVHDWSC